MRDSPGQSECSPTSSRRSKIADIKAARREALLGEPDIGRGDQEKAVPDRDFLDELIDERIARNPNFPAMVESHHDRRLARRLEEDPDFRAEFERQRREIARATQSSSGSVG